MALIGCVSIASAQSVVGKLTQARNAEISTGIVNAGVAYTPVSTGTPVKEGYGIRTRRRSFAEIQFTDGSAIRVNEQTDMVIQSAKTLRKVRLLKGALWVRDEKGSRTSVQTPVGTATARGTEFTVNANGEVNVKEGYVELETGGVSLLLGPGQSGGFGPNGPQGASGGEGGGPGTGGEKSQPWYDQGSQLPDGLIPGGLGVGLLSAQIGDDGNREPEPVPEPGTIAVLAVGAAGVLLRKRRAAKRSR